MEFLDKNLTFRKVCSNKFWILILQKSTLDLSAKIQKNFDVEYQIRHFFDDFQT